MVAIAAAAYAVLRLQLGEQFEGASWRALIELEAPRPYGHRILGPLLARPLLAAGLSIEAALGLLEWLATVGLVVALRGALGHALPNRAAWVGAFAFLFVLPYAYLLQHRWPIFYPWDTPAMLALALAIDLALRDKMAGLVGLSAVAALNRETAILVPVVTLALCVGRSDDRRRLLAWCGLMLVAYVMVREAVAMTVPSHGDPIRWSVQGQWRVVSNLRWLAEPTAALRFLGSLGMLPLLWWWRRRDVDAQLHRLHLPALALGCGLLFVANVYEPRAFGEVMVLAWIPVVVGLARWIQGRHREDEPARPRWLSVIDRVGAPILLVGTVIAIALFHRLPPPA